MHCVCGVTIYCKAVQYCLQHSCLKFTTLVFYCKINLEIHCNLQCKYLDILRKKNLVDQYSTYIAIGNNLCHRFNPIRNIKETIRSQNLQYPSVISARFASGLPKCSVNVVWNRPATRLYSSPACPLDVAYLIQYHTKKPNISIEIDQYYIIDIIYK